MLMSPTEPPRFVTAHLGPVFSSYAGGGGVGSLMGGGLGFAGGGAGGLGTEVLQLLYFSRDVPS